MTEVLNENPVTKKLKRAESEFLNSILGESFKVLDHGYLMVIDYMGNEESIFKAARVSYGKGTKSVSTTSGLIRYLMRHRHTSPVEQCEIAFEIKLPIFIARQWLRHRMASPNEYSMRYSEMIKDFYIPDYRTQSTTNKQGSERLCEEEANKIFKEKTEALVGQAISLYEYFIGPENDVTRELARVVLPVNIYTKMVWKIDLHNLLHFCSLRSKENAQLEIQEYSNIILHQVIKNWVPNVYEAFMDFRYNAVTFSGPVVDFLHDYAIENPDFKIKLKQYLELLADDKRITKREVAETMGVFKDA